MKGSNFILSIALVFSASFGVFAQNFPGCPDVFVGADINLVECSDILLSADVFEVGSTESYEVQSIPYAPPIAFDEPGGTSVSVGTDDVWSNVITLPFEFCFFGDVYTQAKVGSNGAITLGNSLTNGGSHPWSFSNPVPFTSPSDAGQIFGAYHDMQPGTSAGGSVKWYLLGVAPCRTLVVVFDNLPHYSDFYCPGKRSSSMMVLYETTNVIDVYIKRKDLCTNWNSGNAVIGIQNHTATVGYTPPNRNTGTWSVPESAPEAWRFQPNGTSLPYTVEWLEGGNVIASGADVVVNPIGPTEYTARATYTSCTGDVLVVEDVLQVTPTFPNTLEIEITATTDESCYGYQDGTVEITASNGTAPYSYFIDGQTPQSGNTLTDLAPGTYLIGVEDDEGCKRHAQVTIDGPDPIDLTSTVVNVSCFGGDDGRITLSQSGGTPDFTYSLNGGPFQTSNVFNDLTAGTYDATIEDSEGCQETIQVIVTEPNAPTTHITNTVDFFCAEGTVLIERVGVSNGSFSATPSGLIISSITGLVNLENSTPGNYDIVLSFNENGCAYTDTFNITIASVPDIGIPDEIHLCEGEPWTAYAQGGDSISWSNGIENGDVIIDPVGTHSYTVTGVSQNGCQISEVVTVYVHPNPVVDVNAYPTSGIPLLEVTFDDFSTGVDSLYWNFGDGTSEGGVVSGHTYVEPGIYNTTIIGITDEGCADTLIINIEVIYPEMVYEFPNIFTPNGDGENDFFFIKNPQNISHLKFEILNRWGVLVYEFQNKDPLLMNWNGKTHNTGALCTDGVYFYKATLTDMYGEDKMEHGYVHLNRNK
ncbi:MAG: gliding motility-associated C-terminal domain-containing protein [Brumimicrobium sp.]